MIRIDVEGGAGSWGSPGVNPVAGSTIKPGDPIRLIMPSGQGDAKIYYTLDGSVPTRNSAMYNPVADRWLFQKGMTENAPITAPSGSFTIRARIIDIGKGDGPVVSFSFVGTEKEPSDKPGAGTVVETTIDDLIDGGVEVSAGESFFIPASEGSITWDNARFIGYYDAVLGGYLLTPRPGVTGTVEFMYIDKEGVEHTLSVTVEPEDENGDIKLGDTEIPQSGLTVTPGLGSPGSSGGSAGKFPQWAIITLCSVGALAGGFSGMVLPGFIRKLMMLRRM